LPKQPERGLRRHTETVRQPPCGDDRRAQ
jgi:hypothetical protein